MRSCFLSVVIAGVWVTGCSSPTCRPGLVEQEGRCFTGEQAGKDCEPACDPVAHEVCDRDFESPSCTCAPGYDGAPCTWMGVLENKGFEDGTAWTTTRGATVLQDRPGSIDPGVGFLFPRTACNAGGLSQLVEMPAYDVAEPLVAEVTYRARKVYGLSLGFNLVWTQLDPSSDDEWRTERVCLGEAAYGGPVLVQVGAREQFPSCFGEQEPDSEIEVDRLSIVQADPRECPAPGGILNPTAEPDEGGWNFETTLDAEAGFAEAAGRRGSSGVRLARGIEDRVVGWTRLSVPSAASLPSPALRFWWRGDSGLRFRFRIGRHDSVFNGAGALPLDDAIGSGSDENYLYCLPPWTHGNVVDLIFRPLEGPSELVIDDVELVSEAGCGTSEDLLDPGFDAGPARLPGVTNFTTLQAATLRTEPSLSRTGDGGVLELSYSSEAAAMDVETWVLVPEPNGNEGPALTFWAKVPLGTEKALQSVKGRAAVDPRPVRPTGDWELETVCLPSEWTGRWYRVQWRLGELPPVGAANIEPPIRIYIDDLVLTTSLSCRVD